MPQHPGSGSHRSARHKWGRINSCWGRSVLFLQFFILILAISVASARIFLVFPLFQRKISWKVSPAGETLCFGWPYSFCFLTPHLHTKPESRSRLSWPVWCCSLQKEHNRWWCITTQGIVVGDYIGNTSSQKNTTASQTIHGTITGCCCVVHTILTLNSCSLLHFKFICCNRYNCVFFSLIRTTYNSAWCQCLRRPKSKLFCSFAFLCICTGFEVVPDHYAKEKADESSTLESLLFSGQEMIEQSNKEESMKKVFDALHRLRNKVPLCCVQKVLTNSSLL